MIISGCSKLAKKEFKTRQGETLRIVKDIEIWPNEQMLYA